MENRNTTLEKDKLRVLDVAQTLRDRGFKEHYLWHKVICYWNEKDHEIFENIKAGTLKPGMSAPVPRKEYNNGKPRKPRDPASYNNVPHIVVRISDGKEFVSITECSIEERTSFSGLSYRIKHKQGYYFKKDGPPVTKTKAAPGQGSAQVIVRISDGREFPSLKKCSIDEGLPYGSLHRLVEKGIKYKRKS